ncbi:MAG: hypothetical protein AB7G23_16130 [Vicinamibacterales bacterium]
MQMPTMLRNRQTRVAMAGVIVWMAVAAAGRAQAPSGDALPGYFHHAAEALGAYEQSLRPAMNQYRQSAARLEDLGGQTTWVAHREADGLAEIHEEWADLVFVISGEASLQVGGDIDGRYEEAPGELRGPSARGGMTQRLGPGDVVHVPAGMQHRFLVPDGGQITFFTMKIARQAP